MAEFEVLNIGTEANDNTGDSLREGGEKINNNFQTIDTRKVKIWAMAEAFDVDNMTFTASGNIETADLVWPDGEAGTISDVTESDGLITGIRFNYNGKYVELTITYSAGELEKTEWSTNGF